MLVGSGRVKVNCVLRRLSCDTNAMPSKKNVMMAMVILLHGYILWVRCIRCFLFVRIFCNCVLV